MYATLGLKTSQKLEAITWIYPAIFGFLGVILGGVITGLLELWRQVIAGRAVARIIRLEIQENVSRTVLCVAHKHPGITLLDDAWKQLRIQLAPLLPDEVAVNMATNFGAHFIVQDYVSKIDKDFEVAKKEIETWQGHIMLDAILLKQIEKRRRLARLFDLMLGRPTFPSGRKLPDNDVNQQEVSQHDATR